MNKNNDIAEIVVLCIAAIIVFAFAFAVGAIGNAITESEWNNGICNTCLERYELRAVNYGSKYYACPECGNEIKRY